MEVEVGVRIPAMHELLWALRDRDDCTQVAQRELADQMGVTRARIGHVLTRMEDEGRIRRLHGPRGPYKVTDPSVFR